VNNDGTIPDSLSNFGYTNPDPNLIYSQNYLEHYNDFDPSLLPPDHINDSPRSQQYNNGMQTQYGNFLY